MAKVNPITTYTTTIVATNASYSGAAKVVIPFLASRVTVSVFAGSGNPNLTLSFDGATDAAILHGDKTSQASSYTFELQEIDTLWYKQSGTDCHFIVNAETRSLPNIF